MTVTNYTRRSGKIRGGPENAHFAAMQAAWLDQLRAKQELVRRNALIQEVGDWKQACEIRSYLAMLESRMDQGGVTAAGFADWREWAARVADDLDLSKKRVALLQLPSGEPRGD